MALNTLKQAAADPARALAVLATRHFWGSPAAAKALLRASTFLERNPAEQAMRRGDMALLAGDYEGAMRSLRKAVGIQPTVSLMYSAGARLTSGFGDKAMTDAICDNISDDTLKDMIGALSRSPKAFHPSRFWLYYMAYHAFQLDTSGLENFKRTANNSYFTWVGDPHVQEQTAALEGIVGRPKPVTGPAPDGWRPGRWERYLRFLSALYAYAQSKDRLGVLDRLQEPALGNPMITAAGDRRISQDLCHTTIELNAMTEGAGLTPDDSFTAYELGAGHGRIGLAMLSMFPKSRYVVIDIPPSMHISQWYLSKLVQPGPVFGFRDFRNYADVASEFEAARVAFLLPHQAAMLPDKSADFFVNISSIQEMTLELMALWFDQIERLTHGHLYLKEIVAHRNRIDGVDIGRGDYPVKPHWRPVFDRQCEAFPSLFEALYAID